MLNSSKPPRVMYILERPSGHQGGGVGVLKMAGALKRKVSNLVALLLEEQRFSFSASLQPDAVEVPVVLRKQEQHLSLQPKSSEL